MYEALNDQDDGKITFGIKIVLERAANTFPKHRFAVAALMLPKDDSCELELAGKTFVLNLSDDNSDRQPVYDHLLEAIRRWLSAKPWA